jgi:hypothetical protein
MAKAFDPMSWTHVGPFYVQTSRALHYAVWFFAGIGVGAAGVDRGLLAPDGALARRWWLWLGVSGASFAAETLVVGAIFAAFMRGEMPSGELVVLANLGFVVTCAASCMAFLALFVRFAQKKNAVGDSLSKNAYGIYLLHYAAVSWLAFGLLGAELPGAVKGPLVLAGAVAVSWVVTAGLRRVPGASRVLG